MNVYQKLAQARLKFLQHGTTKSGKNMALEFKYFELADIVPIVTPIFNEVGLISIVNYSEEIGNMSIINTDDPSDMINFQTPMRFTDPNRGTNPLQALGASHTYIRRYLYMMALDIVEADAIEPTLTKEDVPEEPKPEKPAPKKSKKPATPVEREEIKQQLTAPEEPASELQINALKIAIRELMTAKPQNEDFCQQIIAKTNGLTKLTKTQGETLINKISEMMENKE